MAQYRPAYRAADFPPLDRPLTPEEYQEAVLLAREVGRHRFDVRLSNEG